MSSMSHGHATPLLQSYEARKGYHLQVGGQPSNLKTTLYDVLVGADPESHVYLDDSNAAVLHIAPYSGFPTDFLLTASEGGDTATVLDLMTMITDGVDHDTGWEWNEAPTNRNMRFHPRALTHEAPLWVQDDQEPVLAVTHAKYVIGEGVTLFTREVDITYDPQWNNDDPIFMFRRGSS